MEKIQEFFKGKKTYIVGIIGASYGVLTAFDLVSFTPKQETAVIALLVALFGITIRAGIAKYE